MKVRKNYVAAVRKWIIPTGGYLPTDRTFWEFLGGGDKETSGAVPYARKKEMTSIAKLYYFTGADRSMPHRSYKTPHTKNAEPWLILKRVLLEAKRLGEPTPPKRFLIEMCQFNDENDFSYRLKMTVEKNNLTVAETSDGRFTVTNGHKDTGDTIPAPSDLQSILVDVRRELEAKNAEISQLKIDIEELTEENGNLKDALSEADPTKARLKQLWPLINQVASELYKLKS